MPTLTAMPPWPIQMMECRRHARGRLREQRGQAPGAIVMPLEMVDGELCVRTTPKAPQEAAMALCQSRYRICLAVSGVRRQERQSRGALLIQRRWAANVGSRHPPLRSHHCRLAARPQQQQHSEGSSTWRRRRRRQQTMYPQPESPFLFLAAQSRQRRLLRIQAVSTFQHEAMTCVLSMPSLVRCVKRWALTTPQVHPSALHASCARRVVQKVLSCVALALPTAAHYTRIPSCIANAGAHATSMALVASAEAQIQQ